MLSLFFMTGSCSNKGDKLVSFTAKTLSGKTIHSDSLHGKIVVIKIWATWCGPCRSEIPALNELVNEYQNDTNVVFLAITDDGAEKISRFIQAAPFNYEQITDATELKNQLQRNPVKYIPEHIVVAPDGTVVFDETKAIADIKTTLQKEIEELKAVGNF